MEAVVKMPLWQVEELKKAQEVITPETKLEQLERNFENYKLNSINNEKYNLQDQIAQLKMENDQLKRKVEDLKESINYMKEETRNNSIWQKEELKNQHSYEIDRLKSEHKKLLIEKEESIMGKDWTITELKSKIDRLENKIETNKWRLRGFWARLLNKEPRYGWGF